MTPRNQRLIRALLKGPLYREQADRIAGASNSPHHISQLRKQGLNIETVRPERIDRDGLITRPGIYVLQKDSIELAKALLEDSGTAGASET